MISSHTEDAKYFVSVKEIQKLKQKDDVFQIYNYPTELLDDEIQGWVRTYHEKFEGAEKDIEEFYGNITKEITEALLHQKNYCLDQLKKKREVVESHVEGIKKTINTVFSVEQIKGVLGDFKTGQIDIAKLNEEIKKFLADEKKNKVR